MKHHMFVETFFKTTVNGKSNDMSPLVGEIFLFIFQKQGYPSNYRNLTL